MKFKLYIYLALGFLGFCSCSLHATFSIVAYDSNTHEYGAALASCVHLAKNENPTKNLSSIIRNKGIIITQATVNFQNNINLRNATAKIKKNYSANSVIQYLIGNDQDHKPNVRQYLVITNALNKVNRKAYSGKLIDTVYSELEGSNYVIAGNTLDSSNVVYKMRDGFVSTQGDLRIKLLAALKSVRDSHLGDRRCTKYGISSTTAFIEVGNYNRFFNSNNTKTDAISGLLQKSTRNYKINI